MLNKRRRQYVKQGSGIGFVKAKYKLFKKATDEKSSDKFMYEAFTLEEVLELSPGEAHKIFEEVKV